MIAIEITMGAAIAGPFDIDQSALEKMIARVLATPPRACRFQKRPGSCPQ